MNLDKEVPVTDSDRSKLFSIVELNRLALLLTT